ncbi:DUF1622 domain-containing protein [Methanofollis fontis]|uniref:DUF1622 domain-containing protein n=1 Tax=Methanofollis fontis TaxID=2052832 RepID=A0A483CS71_9EURY|nr:DUF1622 domain-containing protein [Methanofollis fontis]TAJ44010.1 hypothetical protein CUJ86_08170 [Methanofollis fontis]
MLLEIYGVAAEIFSLAGAIVIIYGGLRAAVMTVQKEVLKKAIRYTHIRLDFTGKIVFGLEFFIAADILSTLIQPTQDELILLGSVVVIRTILGYFLSREAVDLTLD